MNAGSLDTNVVLSLLVAGRSEQSSNVKKLLNQGRRLVISDLVFFEMEYVLRQAYKLDRAAIIKNFSLLINLPQLDCNNALISGLIKLFADNPTLSFADCYLAMQAELNEALPLYTFDQALIKRSGGRAKLVPS